jgi:hypothetical protein
MVSQVDMQIGNWRVRVIGEFYWFVLLDMFAYHELLVIMPDISVSLLSCYTVLVTTACPREWETRGIFSGQLTSSCQPNNDLGNLPLKLRTKSQTHGTGAELMEQAVNSVINAENWPLFTSALSVGLSCEIVCKCYIFCWNMCSFETW